MVNGDVAVFALIYGVGFTQLLQLLIQLADDAVDERGAVIDRLLVIAGQETHAVLQRVRQLHPQAAQLLAVTQLLGGGDRLLQQGVVHLLQTLDGFLQCLGAGIYRVLLLAVAQVQSLIVGFLYRIPGILGVLTAIQLLLFLDPLIQLGIVDLHRRLGGLGRLVGVGGGPRGHTAAADDRYSLGVAAGTVVSAIYRVVIVNSNSKAVTYLRAGRSGNIDRNIIGCFLGTEANATFRETTTGYGT